MRHGPRRAATWRGRSVRGIRFGRHANTRRRAVRHLAGLAGGGRVSSSAAGASSPPARSSAKSSTPPKRDANAAGGEDDAAAAGADGGGRAAHGPAVGGYAWTRAVCVRRRG